jgi:hypothetical protein
MGLTQNHALGRNELFYAKQETVNGTWVKPAGADAAKILKSDFGWKPDRKPRRLKNSTKTIMERVTGKIECPWSVESEIIPSGTAGTPPDLHPLYYAAVGAYTNVGGTSDTYSTTEDQTAYTNTMYRHIPGIWQECVWGAWVDTMTISVSGGGIPTVKFEGGAMGHAQTGTSTLNGAMVGSATMVVATADAWNFEQNSIVQVAANTNTSTGYQVTVATARPSFTLETTLSADTAAAVIPYMPTETTAGSPLAGISGSVSLDGGTIYATGFEVTLKNNFKANTDEALIQYPSDLWPGFRDVTGKITFKARKDWLIKYAKRKDVSTKKAIVLTIGAAAGTRCVITMTYCEFDFENIEIPEADVCMVTVPFVAMGSSGNDEFTLAFT